MMYVCMYIYIYINAFKSHPISSHFIPILKFLKDDTSNGTTATSAASATTPLSTACCPKDSVSAKVIWFQLDATTCWR